MDKLIVNVISLLNYSMKDTGNFALNYLRLSLQSYIPVMIILKLFRPYLAGADLMTLALFIVPIIFFGIGYIFNKLFYFYTSRKV